MKSATSRKSQSPCPGRGSKDVEIIIESASVSCPGGAVEYRYRRTLLFAAPHGCIRLRDEDIEWLYENVPVGTKVYIY